MDGRSESEGSGGSEESGEESEEEEEKKDQQLASEYEEFMKAVSVGEDDEDDDAWGLDREREDTGSCEASDHRDSDSSERNSSKHHDVVHDRSSDVEMGSEVPSSEEASTGGKVVNESSSDSEANRNSISKEEIGSIDEKAVSVKDKNIKRKERSKRGNSESGGESEVEIQIPKKKRKTSGKKLAVVGEGMKKKTGGDKKKKLKAKEKSDKKKKEKERRKKRKKKDRRKKKGRRRRDDSSEAESESEEDEEEGSDSNERAGNTKVSRSKVSDGVHKRRSHRGEPSSEEMSSENSSESSDEADRRKSRKKKRKKRKRHEKPGLSKEDEEELSEDEGEGKKGKVHYSRRKRSREVKNKHHRESDNSDGSEEADDHCAIADDKPKTADDSSVAGKENGVEGGGKRGRKQKLKERGRKKKRKSSPPNPKKHVSSRRRSPSTSDGSPTPGRGNHQRGNSISKTQGCRGGTSEGGPSSIESNSSGGTKKPGDNTVDERKPTESLRRRESSRAEGTSSQKKRNISEREEKRSHDNIRSKSSKTPPASAGKNSGSTNKEKGLRGSASAKRNAQESVVKKRVVDPRSVNTSSSSSSSSSPSSLSVSSLSSSSSSTESSSSASSQSESLSASSSSSSSSSTSSASSSASSLSSSSSSSESSSSISSFANLPGSPNAVSVVSEKTKSEALAKESSKMPPGPARDLSRSGTPPESPETQLSDISFSSLSKDGSKLQEEHFDHFEDSVSKFSGIHGETCKIQVIDRKDSQTNDPPRMKSDCASVDSTNASGCASADLRPLVVMSQDSESENLIDPVDSRGPTCGPFVANETIQLEQKDDSTALNSTSKSNFGSRESKSQMVNPEPLTFKLCSEEDPMNGKILGDRGISASPSQPSRPSRWDTRPVVSECQVLPCVTSGPGSGGREGVREWRDNHHPLTAPLIPVLPVPFPTCQDKPLEEIPLPPVGGVPQPVASPWGPEGPPMSSAPIILSSSELPINPVCGLADSTISDSDLVGKCVSAGGQLQAGPESTPNAKKVSLDKPYIADNRPTSSESERSVVEQFPVDSNHFLKTRVNIYQDASKQSAEDKVVDSAAGVLSVEKHSLVKSNEFKPAALSGDTECVLSPEADQPPTDWDDPEAFVGPGHTEIKSHVIQVGNFLQVVPSEQPIISHQFANPTTPVPAVVPLAAVPSGVAPVPVPPAAPISTVLPVAAPTTISAAFPAPVSPVKTYQPTPSSSNLSLVMPAVQSLPNPPSAAPASPSLVPMPSSTLSSTPPTTPSPLASVAPLIPGLSTTLAPSLPSPTTSSPLSHIPLLASLAPSSSCAGISQLPLDPATILGTLISHALALEKQQKQQQQQQNLVHSPVCSPVVGTENEEVLKETPRAMTRMERQARRMEKRKKMVRGASQQHMEKFPVEDAMSNTDPLTNAMPEDYCIDPEEVAFIQEAMSKVPGEEDEFEEQSPQVCRVKEKRKKPRVVCNTVLPPATRGILIPPGIREKPSIPSGGVGHGLNSGTQGQRKSVMFADGVRPGDGTSPSAGEDLPSPPPPVRKVPKEKRLRKKKKIKVKIIRQIRMESTEEDDDEDDDASPPPPPPGSPPPSLLLHHLSTSSPAIHHSGGGGCEVAIPNPAAHYPYPSAPTAPPTHAFSQLQQPQSASQQQLPPLNPTSAQPMATAGGSAALPPNALPRIPQWAPCN